MNKESADPRPASTVVLLREKNPGLQVYLLRRSIQSGFFPGLYVFPGGSVDSEDRGGDFWLNHVDLDRREIENRFGKKPEVEETLGYGVAAIRETFEEAGVLLARKSDGSLLNTASFCERRSAGNLKKGWLGQRVAEQGWVLSLSRLLPWSHWITPEAFRPRFDTRFFFTLLPGEQQCEPDMREATHGIWIEPRLALAGNMRGETPLSPPTLVTLQELTEYGRFKDLEQARLERSWGEPRLPRLIKLPGGAIIIEPWDPMFHGEIKVDEETLNDRVLPAGRPFSRIWLHQGIWRPVRI
jgi:8-oxo-dGTP pyrophosphatase MutT (NUDIX family)